MNRKLASVQRIVSITPIEGADAIEKATVLGWEVVVAKKDNFKAGDLVCYCEVDSILPDKPEFEFLRERKFRIRTIKLKGQVSQGIVFPLSIIPGNSIFPYKEGDDVTEKLGVRKHDPQAEFERKEAERLASIDKNRMSKFLKRYSWYRKLSFKLTSLFLKPAKVPFPSFIRKTDEDRIQLFPDYYEKWGHLLFTTTEKLDGQSATYFCIPNTKRGLFGKKWLFGVCSRNFQLVKPDNSSYWTLARELNIESKMIKHCEWLDMGLIIQGEAVGRGIQGNKYALDNVELFVFNISTYHKGKKEHFDQSRQSAMCIALGFKTVPLLAYEQPLLPTIPEMVNSAKGYSLLNTQTLREGIVVRNYENNISFKVINPNFLLKYQE
jgi:hypothetical protein